MTTENQEVPLSLEAMLMARFDRLQEELEMVKRMVCPVCGPAIIAEQHPETATNGRAKHNHARS